MAKQFLAIRRGFIEDAWGDLHTADDGGAISLLPVLLILCRGYGDRGAFARVDRIREWSGLHFPSMLAQAGRVLHTQGLVHLLSSPPGVWHFRDGGKVLSPQGERGRIIFPADFVHSGEWGRLRIAERLVLMALGAMAQPVWDLEWDTYFDQETFAWLERNNLMPGDGVREPFIRNCGPLDYRWIADVVMLNKAACREAVAMLDYHGLIAVEPGQKAMFCLPDGHWYLGYKRKTSTKKKLDEMAKSILSNEHSCRSERF